MVKYKGQLLYQIQGKVSFKLSGKLVQIALKDPCPTETLKMAPENPFLNESVYLLRSQPKIFEYQVQDLISYTYLVDCGTFEMKLTNADDSEIDDAIFANIRIIDEP